MGKILVKEHADATGTPFLRGILTRSLVDAGLPFHDAYRLASAVRGGLTRKASGKDDVFITTDELKRIVLKRLEPQAGPEVVERYRATNPPESIVLIEHQDQRRVAFSRYQLQQGVEPCCASSEQAAMVSGRVFEHLVRPGCQVVPSREVRTVAARTLSELIGPEAGRCYECWMRFLHGSRPLLVLIGGAPGCGKSTVASELAHHLGIVRIQSTDMLREVMRLMIPQRLLPALHTSSFMAWETLPVGQGALDQEGQIAEGYMTQAELLSVACEGVIQRAAKEGVSLILEGVHIYPGLLEKMTLPSNAVVVPVMLAVRDSAQLKARIKWRGEDAAASRPSKRYLRHFEAIWSLQSFLLAEADRAQVPIVHNEDKEAAVRKVLKAVMEALVVRERM